MSTMHTLSKLFFKAPFLLGIALVSVAIAPLSTPLIAIAAVPAANPPSARPTPEPLVRPTNEEIPNEEIPNEEPLSEQEQIERELTERELAETANYSDGEISIDYPVGWQVSVNDAGEVSIVDTATDAANDTTLPETSVDPQDVLVETQIFRVAAPPGPLVNANIDSFIEEGSAVSRYTSVEIDEQDALVIWLADRPNELSAAIATFIGYGDETFFLFSRYSPDNEGAENSILRLHSSFVNLSAASPDSTGPDSTGSEPTSSDPTDQASERSSRPPSSTAAPSAQPRR